MTLGENITRLRTAKGMSQGALAETLEVSRQSVSKWETDGSVPELDKLVKLSKLFGVTLDELVTGERAASDGSAAQPPASDGSAAQPPAAGPEPRLIIVEKERPRETRKTVGAVLLIGAFVVILLFALLSGDPWVGVLLALPLILCGVIFLAVRRRPGLVCFWAVGCAMDIYLRAATGITWRYVFLTPYFTREMNYIRLATGWVQCICMAALPVLTIWRLRCGETRWTKKRLAMGWAVFAAAWLAVHFGSRFIPLWYYGWTDWLLLGALTALGTAVIRYRGTRK